MKLGEQLTWTYDNLSSDPARKLEPPSLAIRLGFMNMLLEQGHITEWPVWMNKDGKSFFC